VTTGQKQRSRPGRPRDPQLVARFMQAAVEVIKKEGLHRFSVDGIVAHIGAGKGAFYRRWSTVDHFLADLARHLDAQPVAGLTGWSVTDTAGQRVRDLVEADQ
jgi:AcrR family transcriptional regulator